MVQTGAATWRSSRGTSSSHARRRARRGADGEAAAMASFSRTSSRRFCASCRRGGPREGARDRPATSSRRSCPRSSSARSQRASPRGGYERTERDPLRRRRAIQERRRRLLRGTARRHLEDLETDRRQRKAPQTPPLGERALGVSSAFCGNYTIVRRNYRAARVSTASAASIAALHDRLPKNRLASSPSAGKRGRRRLQPPAPLVVPRRYHLMEDLAAFDSALPPPPNLNRAIRAGGLTFGGDVDIALTLVAAEKRSGASEL